jgi:hypothetical protein
MIFPVYSTPTVTMIFGDVPNFKPVLASVGNAEDLLNSV